MKSRFGYRCCEIFFWLSIRFFAEFKCFFSMRLCELEKRLSNLQSQSTGKLIIAEDKKKNNFSSCLNKKGSYLCSPVRKEKGFGG